MPKVHPEFESGYREGHENGYNLGRRAVDFAKRDLAGRVLVLFEGPFSSKNLRRVDVVAAIKRVFTELGVEVGEDSNEQVADMDRV
jgi:hypothetical protein